MDDKVITLRGQRRAPPPPASDFWFAQVDLRLGRIESIIARHAVLGQLCDNGWLLLWRYEGDDLRRYERGRWLSLDV